jgi:hypothetical protein
MMMREMGMTVTPEVEVSLTESLTEWMTEAEVRSSRLTEVSPGAGSKENLPGGGIGKVMISLPPSRSSPLPEERCALR